jgi:two-component system chemotaxis response regulator CheB
VTASGSRIKVLIVDDSAIVRKILTETISAEKDMEVVGTAPDPFIARDKILALKPDVLTLDIEMPRMDGLTFLKKLMAYHPMPVIIISSLTQSSCEISMEALRCGAVEVMAKPGGPYSIGELRTALASKLRAAAYAQVRKPAPATAPSPSPPILRQISRSSSDSVVLAIGASTGGTEAIRVVLESMPVSAPGIVIAQHIPPVFSAAFASRLNKLCSIEVSEAKDGDEVRSGRALVAPGNFHMVLRRNGGGYRVEVRTGPQVCYQRPSVDVLFSSVAEAAGDQAIGALLTGMGADGAQGLLRMKQKGAQTIAQDEESCVVYGMPREAVKLGAAGEVLPLTSIASAMLKRYASGKR